MAAIQDVTDTTTAIAMTQAIAMTTVTVDFTTVTTLDTIHGTVRT
jgi:hypothetical protein